MIDLLDNPAVHSSTQELSAGTFTAPVAGLFSDKSDGPLLLFCYLFSLMSHKTACIYCGHTHTTHARTHAYTHTTDTHTTHNKKTATKTQPQANTLSLASIKRHGRPPRIVVPVEKIGFQNLVEPSGCSHKLSLFWHNSTGL